LLELAAFSTMAALRICDPLLPAFAREFNVTSGSAGRTVSAFAIAYAIALLLYGPLADRLGKLRVIFLATLASAAGSVGCALATSLDDLVMLRAISGAAAAGVTPIAMAWIGDNVPYELRQKSLARLIGATTLGLIAAQWLGGLVADAAGWRSAFVLLALLFAVATLLLMRELRGSVQAAAPGQPETSRLPGFGHRTFDVLSKRWSRRILIFSFCEGLLVFGGLAFLPTHLHHRFDLSMGWVGAIVTLYGLGGILYSRIAGALLARLGETGLASIGGALMCLYFSMLALAWTWMLAVPACLLGGLGFYMLHTTLQTHATEMVPQARGTAVTLFSAALFMGQSAGVAVAAAIVDRTSAVPVFIASAIGIPILAGTFAHQIRLRKEALRRNASAAGGASAR